MKSKKSNSTNSDTNNPEPFAFKVGKIVGFRGLKGEMKVLPSTNSPDILLEIDSVKIGDSENSKETNVISIRKNGKMVSLMLDGYPDRNSVEPLKNKHIYTQKTQLLDLLDNEFWSNDLLGLKVLDEDGEILGKISEIYGDEGQFLEIELSHSKEKKLIPFITEFVPEIDIDNGSIRVTPPEGLFD